MRLQNKVALVTGAGSGIGQAIATRFAHEGAHVIINYRPGSTREEEAAKAMAASFTSKAIAVAADVSQRADVERMMETTLAEFGRLDIAVCNAGVCPEQPFLETTDEHWNLVLGVNLYGAFVVSQLAARQMVRQGEGGKIIFTSSVHEDIPYPRYTAYCASKGGLRLMMRNIAIELSPYKINVNNIAPGAIATPMNQAVLDDPEEMAKANSEIPWGRFGSTDEVAAVALFLASDEASYVTGSTYFVDGGLTHQVTAY
jgi:glucose 1-dehydrogenase